MARPIDDRGPARRSGSRRVTPIPGRASPNLSQPSWLEHRRIGRRQSVDNPSTVDQGPAARVLPMDVSRSRCPTSGGSCPAIRRSPPSTPTSTRGGSISATSGRPHRRIRPDVWLQVAGIDPPRQQRQNRQATYDGIRILANRAAEQWQHPSADVLAEPSPTESGHGVPADDEVWRIQAGHRGAHLVRCYIAKAVTRREILAQRRQVRRAPLDEIRQGVAIPRRRDDGTDHHFRGEAFGPVENEVEATEAGQRHRRPGKAAGPRSRRAESAPSDRTSPSEFPSRGARYAARSGVGVRRRRPARPTARAGREVTAHLAGGQDAPDHRVVLFLVEEQHHEVTAGDALLAKRLSRSEADADQRRQVAVEGGLPMLGCPGARLSGQVLSQRAAASSGSQLSRWSSQSPVAAVHRHLRKNRRPVPRCGRLAP